jgi:hypothetical protein
MEVNMEIVSYLAARADNDKTGDVPTVWIGINKEQARASCDAVECKLRPWAPNRSKDTPVCFAHGGTPAMGLSSIARSHERGTLNLNDEQMLKQRAKSARFIRIGAIGDPAVKPWGWWYRIRRLAKKYGLKTIAYTHGWRKRPDLVGMTMASVDSLDEVAEAKAMGFQVAVATREVDPKTKTVTLPDGTTARVCRAINSKACGKPMIQCNQCLWCTGDSPDLTVIFPDHGPGSPTRMMARSKPKSKFNCR